MSIATRSGRGCRQRAAVEVLRCAGQSRDVEGVAYQLPWPLSLFDFDNAPAKNLVQQTSYYTISVSINIFSWTLYHVNV